MTNNVHIMRNFRILRCAICSLCVCAAVMFSGRGGNALAKDEDKKAERGAPASEPMEIFSADEQFISSLVAMDLMKRDRFLFGRMNRIVESTAVVFSVDDRGQFRKRYRIIAKSPAGRGIIIQFNVYTDNAEYETLLTEGQKFSFRGQLVMVTPVTSRRDYYIFDVILQDGAAVVE